MQQMPQAETDVNSELVLNLLREQHPDLAGEKIIPFDAGWDNATFKLGKRFAVRIPRRELASSLVKKEQKWLPLLPTLPLATPQMVRVGNPSRLYPWHWSVVSWIDGTTADVTPPKNRSTSSLAEFLLALHQRAPSDLPLNPVRGGHLADRREALETRLLRVRNDLTKSPLVIEAWRQAIEAPSCIQPTWVHGDIHARNVLVAKGELAGVIDWGDLCAGDPATDLASIWALFDCARARQSALCAYRASPELVARAKGWVVILGAALLDMGASYDHRHEKLGADMLRRLTQD